MTAASGVEPSVAVELRTDTSPAAQRVAIHDDLVRSAVRRRTIPGERLVRDRGITAYRCDLPSADVNVVIETHVGPGQGADRRIAETIAFFEGRPFLWWVGDDDEPADLGDRLNRLGVG